MSSRFLKRSSFRSNYWSNSSIFRSRAGHYFQGVVHYNTVAVVGSGPAGLSTTKLLLKNISDIKIDIYEKLPAPFGLIRYGVAPDNVPLRKLYEKYNLILGDKRVNLFANVEVGKYVSYQDLLRLYDATILTTGAEKPNVPSIEYDKNIKNIYLSDEIVKWYNGHPDSHNIVPPDLSNSTNVVIVGLGNVTLDLARLLLLNYDTLKVLEIPDPVLRILKSNNVSNVKILGRRGPANSKFSAQEMRSMNKITGMRVVTDVDLLENSLIKSPNGNFRVVQILKKLAERSETDQEVTKTFSIDFFSEIKEIIPNKDTNSLRKLSVVRNSGQNGSFIEKIPCDILIFSLGYGVTRFEDLPLCESSQYLLNSCGRVLDANKKEIPGLFVSGWLKIGGKGTLDRTIRESQETVAHVCEYLKTLKSKDNPETTSYSMPALIQNKLNNQNVQVVNKETWFKIDKTEKALGVILGKPREKFVSVEDMLKVSVSNAKV